MHEVLFERYFRQYFTKFRQDGIDPADAAALAIRVSRQRITNEFTAKKEHKLEPTVENIEVPSEVTEAKSDIDNEISPPVTTQQTVDEIDDDRVRICRICFGFSNEDGLGKVIRPCHCKGSIQYIHIECLNAWRRSSSNPRSYHECEQCGYKYRIHRTSLALFLLKPETPIMLTILVIALAAFFIGCLFCLLSPWHIPQRLYHLCFFNPPWRHWHFVTENSFFSGVVLVFIIWLKSTIAVCLDMFAVGAASLGFIGFVLVVRRETLRHWGTNEGRRHLFMSGLWLSSLNSRWSRFAVGIGLVYAYSYLFQQSTVICKDKAQKWGERLLQIDEDHFEDSSVPPTDINNKED